MAIYTQLYRFFIFEEEINPLLCMHRCIKLIKIDSKDKKLSQMTQILSSAIVFNIDGNNVSLAANQLISMISEGSCDTEDWSNDAENTALRHNNKWHFNRY